jgi:aminoglycoside phosphotransferase (APT) family kinase protein
MTEQQTPPEMRRSSRDPAVQRERFTEWLRGKHADAAVTDLQGTSATGMSSDTLLVDATWSGEPHRLVVRRAPDADDVPVFPAYDLTRQFRIIRAVAEHTDVPVPDTLWNEPDPEPLGTPFFVMSQVEGIVPPDVMPYDFGDSWLFDASPEQQRTLQDATVDVLAKLHAMPPQPYLELAEPGATALRRHVAHTRAWYDFVADDGAPSPLIEQGFAWLEKHWPEEPEPVVLWGDARIGNVLYQDFRPAAVLDWEMAAVGPRELDVAWLVYAHRNFEDIAHAFGLPGMPDFLRREDVLNRYVERSGYEPRDLDFYETYSALQFAIVFLRTGTRQVHFGERELPADPDELLYNREPLTRMLEGTYF